MNLQNAGIYLNRSRNTSSLLRVLSHGDEGSTKGADGTHPLRDFSPRGWGPLRRVFMKLISPGSSGRWWLKSSVAVAGN